MARVSGSADDPRRLPRRRAITLDLFTRHGQVWTAIASVRREWRIEPSVSVPRAPGASASDVGLLTRAQMPERFSLPPVPPDRELETVQAALSGVLGEDLLDHAATMMTRTHERLHVGQWLLELRALHEAIVPEGNPSGTNIFGWMTWAPFLSACVLHDPPEVDLLAFADHDDHEAARLSPRTFWQDSRAAIEAERIRANAVSTSSNLQDQMILHALGTQRMASTCRPSDPPVQASRSRGRLPLDDLVAVQCAILKRRGWTHHAIAEVFGWREHPESTDQRHRKNRSEDHVKRGEELLHCRKYSS